MISWSQKTPSISIGLKEVCRCLNKGIEISALTMLRSTLAEIGSSIIFALHRTEQIPDIQDARIPLLCLLQMDRLQPLVGVGVVVVGVGPEEEVGVPVGIGSITEIDPVATWRRLLDGVVHADILGFFDGSGSRRWAVDPRSGLRAVSSGLGIG